MDDIRILHDMSKYYRPNYNQRWKINCIVIFIIILLNIYQGLEHLEKDSGKCLFIIYYPEKKSWNKKNLLPSKKYLIGRIKYTHSSPLYAIRGSCEYWQGLLKYIFKRSRSDEWAGTRKHAGLYSNRTLKVF